MTKHASSVRGGTGVRVVRALVALTTAGGFALALPVTATTAMAAPASALPFVNPAHQHAAPHRAVSTRAQLGAAPAVVTAPAHTFHPVANAPDEPQDPAFLNSGTCHSTPSGVCTLRAAVMEANAEQKYIAIVLTSGTYHLTIPPTTTTDASTGDLDITDPGTVTITGNGLTHTFIDGAGMSTGPGNGDRIFQLEGNAVAHMTGLTVQHGYATGTSSTNTDPGYGGGIDIPSRSAALVLQSVRVASNAADAPSVPAGYGGGLHVNGSLWAKDSQFSGNAARYDGGGLYLDVGSAQLVNVAVNGNTGSEYGGGIYVGLGTLSVQGGTISGNHLVVADGFTGQGGGIDIDDATTLVGTTISDNTISMASGATSGTAQGGGVFNEYGLNQADHLTVRNNSVSGLDDEGDTCCGDGGGGIYDYYGFELTNSVLTGNKALSGNGGGLLNYGDNEHLSSVTITNNTAAGSGGGIFAVSVSYVNRSTISGNTAGRNGGGFWSRDGQQIDQTLISGNTATQGGGFFNAWVALLTNDTLTGNRATGTGSAGGAFYNSGANGGSSAQLTNITISGNRSDDGGGIVNGGGGVAVHNTIIAANKNLAGNTDTNCDISQNGAQPLTDGGHNLDSGHTCALTGPGDRNNSNPKLGALANNGGPTRTQALLSGSPAINTGSQPAPSIDQRGVQRDSRPDIGAFEKH